MTAPRWARYCLSLAVLAAIGAAFGALTPSAPPSLRPAAPRSALRETRSIPPPSPFETVEQREPEVAVLTPSSDERQPPKREVFAPADAGPESRVPPASSTAPPEVSDDATHDVIAATTAASHTPRLGQARDDATFEGREPKEPLPRRIELTAFRVWQQPGLCVKAEAASEAHGRLMRHFRVVDEDGGARFYVDPRLPLGAQRSLLAHLEEAKREARIELGLVTPSPDVFVYHDVELLLAAACTNEDVVAYYDGALHVVLHRADVRESILHEYAHHALMTNGILGPAWAQEGIAMHVARETWWLTPQWLERVADQPFSMDVMEREIPYTLSSEQAVLFYVQAAAMVACATREQPADLAGLVRALRASHSGGELSYALPAPATPASLRACVKTLLRGADGHDAP